MYVAFFEDNYIFVHNFNISSRSYQPIPWNYNKYLAGRGAEDRVPTYEAECRGPRKTNAQWLTFFQHDHFLQSD